MGGIVIPADRLPRRHEVVCADAASGFAAGLVYCIFGLILVILDINIIYLHPFRWFMAQTITKKNENEVKVYPSGKRIRYNGLRWVRKDIYDRANECIVSQYHEIGLLEDEIEELRCKLDDAGIPWKVSQ